MPGMALQQGVPLRRPKPNNTIRRRPRHIGKTERDDSDAMEGVTMPTGDPVVSNSDANEYTTDPTMTANIEMAGMEPLTQRPATSRDRQSALTRNADGKRPGNALKALTDLGRSLLKELKDQRKEHETSLEALMTEIEGLQARMAELTDTINNRPSTIDGQSPAASYADVAATPPNSQPSNMRTIALTGSAGSLWTDNLHCTIDTSRTREESPDGSLPGSIRQAIKAERRTREGHARWQCAAIIRDARNAKRIKVVSRDENKLLRVKESAQRALPSECQILRGQLFPVKVDNANRTAVLDQEGQLLPGTTQALGRENEVTIAKISWLSKKDTRKAYGSMVGLEALDNALIKRLEPTC